MKCSHCSDTGSISRSLYGYLDCASCDAADERAKFNEWLRSELDSSIDEGEAWLIYQRGKRAAVTA